MKGKLDFRLSLEKYQLSCPGIALSENRQDSYREQQPIKKKHQLLFILDNPLTEWIDRTNLSPPENRNSECKEEEHRYKIKIKLRGFLTY